MAKKHFKFMDLCHSCRKVMGAEDQIVFVEEDAGRYFCSEKCIRDFYDPLGDEYKKLHMAERDPHDIPETDFIKYESYAPLCLSNPDELWRDVSENGEVVNIFIGNFTDQGGAFYFVVAGYCMDQEPTYILLAFPTRDRRLVDKYRVGTKVEISEESQTMSGGGEPEMETVTKDAVLERQARAIEEEMMRHRAKDDIPVTEFEEHAHHLEHTLENPSEIWELEDGKSHVTLTMISQPEEDFYYVVICQQEDPLGGQEAWRVLYAFPTKDEKLVQRYRRGQLQAGGSSGGASSPTNVIQ
jgi:hypothetical protein